MHPNRKDQQEEIDEKLRLPSQTIYGIISTEGREELARPTQSLAWSALVAGICISFSLFCEAFLKFHTPEGSNFFLLENLGYTVGFLIVILGRLQLFTENTITVVLPLLEHFSAFRFFKTMKLWALVLGFNFIGTFLTAFLVTYLPFVGPEMFDVFIDISKHAVEKDAYNIFIEAIPAGFLIAALVWMLPSSESFQFWVILLMTYVIAVGDFAHIVAGSAEAFLLVLNGHISIMHCLSYLGAACAGNVIGGTGLFAVMAYAQVREEM